ncbi:MAG: hypothetical protein EHM24_03375, partial [Acidobacteria bacterium]
MPTPGLGPPVRWTSGDGPPRILPVGPARAGPVLARLTVSTSTRLTAFRMPTPMVLRLGPFRIDRSARVLYRDGRVVSLTPKAFDTLLLLVDRAGEVLTKEELIKGVWPDTHVEEGSLARNISAIRQALGERRGTAEYIQTIAKRGYRLTIPVELVPEAETGEQVNGLPEGPPTPADGAPPTPGRWAGLASVPWLVAGAVLVVLAALVVGGTALRRGAATTAAGASRVESMAVLPFRTSADAGQEFLGVGLAEALVARLAGRTSVMVPSMATTRLYTAANKDATQVGRDMGVDSVLEGQVQRSSARLRASLRLVRVADGRVLWSDTYDEPLENLFALQDAIADRVGVAVAGRLGAAPPAPATKPEGTADVEAYQLYLRGQYVRERRDKEGYATAKAFFEQALGRDPRFVAAHVANAEVLLAECWMGWLPLQETEARAEAILAHALSLDADLPAAHGAMAQLRWHQWRWTEVKSELERAMALAPQQGKWYDQYAVQYLLPLRQFDEALRLLRRAQALDPLSRGIGAHTAAALFYMGKLDDAIAEHRQVLVLEPRFASSYFGLAQIYAEQKRWDAAEQAYRRTLEIWPDQAAVVAAMGHMWGESGQAAKAREALARVRQVAGDKSAAGYLRANVHMGLGEKDLALSALEEALAARG